MTPKQPVVRNDRLGNLILMVLAQCAARSVALHEVVAGVALSPVTDLTMSGDSWQSQADADPFFVQDQVAELILNYLGNQDTAAHEASPLFGNLSGLPAIRVHVGEAEVLFDDSWRYVEQAVNAGVDAKLDVWQGVAHGFLGGIGRLDAANQALGAIGAFLATRLVNDRAI